MATLGSKSVYDAISTWYSTTVGTRARLPEQTPYYITKGTGIAGLSGPSANEALSRLKCTPTSSQGGRSPNRIGKKQENEQPSQLVFLLVSHALKSDM